MDVGSELAENGLEFMAMDMRTQPTSPNSILELPNLDFGSLFFVFLCISRVLKPKIVFMQFYMSNIGRD